MATIRECIETAHAYLAQAKSMAVVQQSDATYELSNGRFSPLVEATEQVEALRMVLQQLDHLLDEPQCRPHSHAHLRIVGHQLP